MAAEELRTSVGERLIKAGEIIIQEAYHPRGLLNQTGESRFPDVVAAPGKLLKSLGSLVVPKPETPENG